MQIILSKWDENGFNLHSYQTFGVVFLLNLFLLIIIFLLRTYSFNHL